MAEPSPLERVTALIAQGEPRAAEALLREHADEPRCAGRLRELLLGAERREEALELARELSRSSGAEAAVSRSLLALVAGDLDRAEAEARSALEIDARSATARHHLGRALHNRGAAPRAIAALREATEIDPSFAEAWNSLGHALRATGDLRGAVAAFRRALMQAPAFRAAWKNLGLTLYNLEETEAALQCFERMLARDPEDVDALLGRGLCRQMARRLDEARGDFEQVMALAPDNALAHLYHGILMNELTDSAAAIRSLERALELEPDDVEAWAELAGVYEQSNRLEDVERALAEGLRRDPGHPSLLLESARLARRRGDVEQALATLGRVDPRGLPRRVAMQYHHERGLALDRSGEADTALRAFEESNRLAAEGSRHRAVDRGAFGRRIGRLEQWLASGAPGLEPAPGDPPDDRGPDLCFLVGFPRSGTTLVDTTLATSEHVAALEEAATLDFAVRELQAATPPYPGVLASLSPADVTRLRQGYREAVARLLGGAGAGRVIDKNPLRFIDAGLAARLFPESRWVFVLRHPCDVVLSNFMQQYAVNDTNVHFDSLRGSAETYDRLMRLWQSLEEHLSESVLYVRYEDLVADLEQEIRRVCEFLGLDPATVRFDARARLATRDRVRTASYQQVAEPIYDRAAGRWQRYRRHLEPFFPLLEPHARRLGYAPLSRRG